MIDAESQYSYYSDKDAGMGRLVPQIIETPCRSSFRFGSFLDGLVFFVVSLWGIGYTHYSCRSE